MHCSSQNDNYKNNTKNVFDMPSLDLPLLTTENAQSNLLIIFLCFKLNRQRAILNFSIRNAKNP